MPITYITVDAELLEKAYRELETAKRAVKNAQTNDAFTIIDGVIVKLRSAVRDSDLADQIANTPSTELEEQKFDPQESKKLLETSDETLDDLVEEGNQQEEEAKTAEAKKPELADKSTPKSKKK